MSGNRRSSRPPREKQSAEMKKKEKNEFEIMQSGGRITKNPKPVMA
jgi:hypothetical protein